MNDLISRQNAIEHIKHRLIETALNNVGYCSYDISDVYKDISENRIETWIKELPSAQKTGYWIEHENLKKDGISIECPSCGYWFLHEHLLRNSFCPNCGSRNKWKGEEDE